MDNLFHLLQEDPALINLTSHKQPLGNLSDVEEILLLAASFKQNPRNLVVIKPNTYTAQQLFYRLYPLLKDDVLLFTVEQSLRVEAVAASSNIYIEQINALTQMTLNNSKKIIVTHPAAIRRYLCSKETFVNHIIKLEINQQYSINKIKQLLFEAGYKYVNKVDQPLTFSTRGSIIDVFTTNNENPLRIEFFDDEIESIRFFDYSSQRTIEKIDSCIITPASCLICDDYSALESNVLAQLEKDKAKSNNFEVLKENILRDLDYFKQAYYQPYMYRYLAFYQSTNSVLDYIDNPDVIFSNCESIESSNNFVDEENNEYIRELYLDNEGLNYYSLFDDFNRVTEKHRVYNIYGFAQGDETIKSAIKLTYFPLLPLDQVVKEIVRLANNNRIFLLINKGQSEILSSQFQQKALNINDYAKIIDIDLFEGFNYQDNIFLTAKELFGIKTVKSRYESKFREATVLDNYTDLEIGDYIVHNQYGIGRYEGIVTKEVAGKIHDYLRIAYRDEEYLMVPLEQFKLVRKFVGSQAISVRLSKLGSNSWNKAKERIGQEVNDIAERLIKLYSAREEKIGYAFSKDDELSKAFEDNFQYELTKDQIKAITEIKYDMEQPIPMDRLLCGDVGFGKTEVAMIAAFKAVKDGKQVAYLCPTTILSMQHYKTFIERFKGFPVKIALLNRFITDSDQKQIIKEVQQGKVDILIGTHRIISDDVKFKDLGLLIIDEEQRFGVVAKEKIKEIKQSIDVLSLSATPIPRTLQMSLIGVMSLSQLETPPRNRMPIQTYVVEKNDNLIKEVIQRELARNGQVFYLHNNVSNIYDLARKLSIMLPTCKIVVGHGQMNREEIEDVMYSFVKGDYDILLCTTIIETGIDIPNVNTILIDNAENFGLAQLYQIRGRVGRSDKVAYAYLMYQNRKQLSEVATKRLQAIKEFTQLGSGYKIALRDLTIRGAGDLLGEKQAGFINTVGMSLYLNMLNSAIKEKKGIASEIIEKEEIKVNDIDGYIPQQFVPVDYEKISIYQQLAVIDSQEKLDDYNKEICDLYGKLPNSINGLFDKKRLELMLNNGKIEKYDSLSNEYRIILTKQCSDSLDGVKLFEAIDAITSLISLKYSQGKITIVVPKVKNHGDYLYRVLGVINNL